MTDDIKAVRAESDKYVEVAVLCWKSLKEITGRTAVDDIARILRRWFPAQKPRVPMAMLGEITDICEGLEWTPYMQERVREIAGKFGVEITEENDV